MAGGGEVLALAGIIIIWGAGRRKQVAGTGSESNLFSAQSSCRGIFLTENSVQSCCIDLRLCLDVDIGVDKGVELNWAQCQNSHDIEMGTIRILLFG